MVELLNSMWNQGMLVVLR
ncbi:hypothetical protein MTR67_001422 [Solanum verrucosum]|uniref:Uncharacterized protein n=1 Tax=Solanum verrucosum TaxID=315347 RepID=A0AAF0PNM0_SOLVR|nr:hypothetical protein MTR67_001422 [Solanum verrucosum]